MNRLKRLVRAVRDFYVIKNSGLFDANYYLANNTDVRHADINPLKHYVKHGGLEGRNPSAEFDGESYLKRYQDIKQADINLLSHYLRCKKSEGRAIAKEGEQPKGITLSNLDKKTNPLNFYKKTDVYMSCWLTNKESVHDILFQLYDHISEFGFGVAFVSNSNAINESVYQKINTHFLLTRTLFSPTVNDEVIDALFIDELVEVEKHWLSKLELTFQGELVQRVKGVYTLWYNHFKLNPPKLFLIWGSSSPLSKLHIHLCKRFGIDYLILERGHFPRSLLVDQVAQFGHSARLSMPQSFQEFTSGFEKEFSQIKDYLAKVEEIPYADKNQLSEIRFNDKQINILMIGVNDLGCGISYGSENFKERHSSYYYSTKQAFVDVVKSLGHIKEDLKLYFKPHPADKFNYKKYSSEKVEVIECGNINQLIERADVCITLNTTAIAKVVLESKPLVTMSLTDVSFLNIAYEVYQPSDLVFQLRQAINKFEFEKRNVAGKKFLVELLKRNSFFLDDFASFSRRPIQLSTFITTRLSENERSLSNQEIENGVTVAECKYHLIAYGRLEEDKKPYVDVIVPIYGDAETTNTCIQAAKKAVEKYRNARLILINDCSPYPEIKALFSDFKNDQSERFVVLENAENLGFSGTVNRGLTMSENNDVLLLNSDAFVTENTILELASSAYANNQIATVTPMSNNAGLMSNPLKGGQELELGNAMGFVEKKNKIAQRNNQGKAIEIPIGHGFCLYIKRKAIKRVGIFDELAFGKGYSEEIDFCMRARRLGLIHLGLLSTYVGHIGGVSFGQDSNPLKIKNRDVIKLRYPNYFKEIRSFMENDPLKSYRV